MRGERREGERARGREARGERARVEASGVRGARGGVTSAKAMRATSHLMVADERHTHPVSAAAASGEERTAGVEERWGEERTAGERSARGKEMAADEVETRLRMMLQAFLPMVEERVLHAQPTRLDVLLPLAPSLA